MRRRWSELSPRARRVIVIAGTADAVLRAVALADLARRPADAVRGSKRSWAAAVGLVSSAGAVPIAYLVLGRRRTSGR